MQAVTRRRARCVLSTRARVLALSRARGRTRRTLQGARACTPWFHGHGSRDSRAPPRSPSSPSRGAGSRPNRPPPPFSPNRRGQPRRPGPTPQGLSPTREPADLRETRSSHEVPAAVGRRSGAFRCPPPRTPAGPRKSKVFGSSRLLRSPGPVARAARPLRVTGISKNHRPWGRASAVDSPAQPRANSTGSPRSRQ